MCGAKWRASPTESVNFAVKSLHDLASDPISAHDYESMPTISVDASSGGQLSQHHTVIVQTIFTPGIDRAAHTFLNLQLGMSGRSKISQETGNAFLCEAMLRWFPAAPATTAENPAVQ